MIPASFDYAAPEKLSDALSLLSADPEAKALAGGHSLIPTLRLRLAAPSKLVDLGRIPDLQFIVEDGGRIRIGAMTTHHQIESSELLAASCPLLAVAAAAIGDVQVRNRGTIGGALAHADPAADYPAALLALEAQVTLIRRPPLPTSWENRGSLLGTALGQIVSGARKAREEIREHDPSKIDELKQWRLLPNKQRTLSYEDFLLEAYTTALEPGELLTEVSVPLDDAGFAYETIVQPASGYAIVGVAARVRVEDGKIAMARVAVTGLASKPYRATAVEQALEDQEANKETIAAAAAKATDGQDPLSDLHASADYRAHLAAVYVRRAVEKAAGV